MENCFVVNYDIKERKELYLFLRLLGYKWANGKKIENQEHCFPFCIDIKRKVVYMTNTNFLREFSGQGHKMISFNEFKKVVEA
ncbi:MAG: hypothetical protein IJA23_06715 [Clostridia bacterium]|nr:hypothetical protein [Clostridia bacterium]